MPKFSDLIGASAAVLQLLVITELTQNGIVTCGNVATGEVVKLSQKNLDNAMDADAITATGTLAEKNIVLQIPAERVFHSDGLTMIRIAESRSLDTTPDGLAAVKAALAAAKV